MGNLNGIQGVFEQSAFNDPLQDHEHLLNELEHMHQADRLRKRQQVSTVPSGMPKPLYTRQEVREDFQREMEFALEDMYTGERGMDLVTSKVLFQQQNNFCLWAMTS